MPQDVLLLIEVSDASVGYDREHKLKLYAEHGIVEAWLLDLNARQLEIHLEPSTQGYRRLLKPAPDAVVAPTRIEAIRFQAGTVFPG